MRQMVILAGGMGTRLRERLDGRPKPLIEIGGTPLLEHQVLLAKRHGVGRVLLLVNYAADRIAEFCSARGDWGIEVECLDDGEPLGTAGAVLGAFERLDDEFLVVYGDTMIGVDLTRFCAFHRSLPEPAFTLLLHPNDHPQDSDLVEMDEEGRIVAFHPYPHNLGHVFSNLVNAALYVVRRTALAPYRGMRGPLDFGKDLFPDMLHREMPLFGYNSPEYIKDCGTPSRLEGLSRFLLRSDCPLQSRCAAGGSIRRSGWYDQRPCGVDLPCRAASLTAGRGRGHRSPQSFRLSRCRRHEPAGDCARRLHDCRVAPYPRDDGIPVERRWRLPRPPLLLPASSG